MSVERNAIIASIEGTWDGDATLLVNVGGVERVLWDHEQAREHMADLVRTRIEPGADPRALWDSFVDEVDAASSANPVVYEIQDTNGNIAALYGDSDYLVDECGYPRARLRYVPEDVRRWRNRNHRGFVERRAREWAAVVPGRHTNSTPVACADVNRQSTSNPVREG